MMKQEQINSFEDLKVWQTAHKLVLSVYKITKKFPKSELYGVISQLRRAALSVTSNIAEGFSRYHYNDKIRFYHNARGSVSEVRNCLILARDMKYIAIDIYTNLSCNAKDVLKMINGLIRSIENQK